MFNDKEWKELTDDRLGIPDIPFNIAEELAKYGNKNLKELRKAVMTSYLPDNVPYDSGQHYDLEWIQTSIRTIVGLYENDDSPFKRKQYEHWYTVALFGACIDVAYRDATLGTDIKRFHLLFGIIIKSIVILLHINVNFLQIGRSIICKLKPKEPY